MRGLCLLLVFALFASPAWAKSPELARAIDLYETGQLSQARDQLRLLVDKRHFSERDRIQARLYLAATDLALQDPDSAREQLRVLAKEHPKVRPDPSVFSPELVVLADQIRADVAQERTASRTPRDGDRQAEAKARADQQKQLEAQRQAEQQKQADAKARAAADQQKQLEAQRQAEQQKQVAASNPQPTVGSQPDLTPHLTPTTPLETQQAPAVEHSSRRTWGYVALGVAAGAAVVGALFASGAKSDADKAASATTGTAYTQAKGDADSKASVASASFIAAGLAAAGGGVLIGTSF